MNKTNLVSNIVFIIAIVVIFLGVYYLSLTMPRERVYNCSIAEISPDFPIEVREKCRNLRMDKIK